jgi:hypothetical protein
MEWLVIIGAVALLISTGVQVAGIVYGIRGICQLRRENRDRGRP